ncbi:hypothetical protein [Maridesulfovibrio sp. FT414]|uniref:hypothetical protein n=1 Tax=Maridesulfovibrio sp. FT414 TaxID=2979469 RepID=UPI003D807470
MENNYFGARVTGDGEFYFRIFAPHVQQAEIVIESKSGGALEMAPSALGFHEISLPGVGAGTL